MTPALLRLSCNQNHHFGNSISLQMGDAKEGGIDDNDGDDRVESDDECSKSDEQPSERG